MYMYVHVYAYLFMVQPNLTNHLNCLPYLLTSEKKKHTETRSLGLLYPDGSFNLCHCLETGAGQEWGGEVLGQSRGDTK